jgi:23S rRNA G2445 N2-methylase RlmL
MAKSSTAQNLPACYALCFPGLERIAGDEIREELKGEIKKVSPGVVVFRVREIDRELFKLRTVEDVFLLIWGTDELSYRAKDLGKIQTWTARERNWNKLLQIHHSIRRKPAGKPTYRLVVQMTGEHGYRRADAYKSLARGLSGKLPASWRLVEEDAAVEIWLTIHGAIAVCGLRLSDRTMRHRSYKIEHQPASLRPTVAAAMVRMADLDSGQTIFDPMCGAGTILAEVLATARSWSFRVRRVIGGDREMAALRAAASNLRRLGQAYFARWDATRLPLSTGCADRIICNPPFGKQLASEVDLGVLYTRIVREFNRALRPGAKAVLLVADLDALNQATARLKWKRKQQIRVRILGQRAFISVWEKE